MNKVLAFGLVVLFIAFAMVILYRLGYLSSLSIATTTTSTSSSATTTATTTSSTTVSVNPVGVVGYVVNASLSLTNFGRYFVDWFRQTLFSIVSSIKSSQDRVVAIVNTAVIAVVAVVIGKFSEIIAMIIRYIAYGVAVFAVVCLILFLFGVI